MVGETPALNAENGLVTDHNARIGQGGLKAVLLRCKFGQRWRQRDCLTMVR